VAVGRQNWTFAGSDAGGNRAAAFYVLTETCKMTTLIRRPGSLTCWQGFQITPSTGSSDLLP
jgi:transposase